MAMVFKWSQIEKVLQYEGLLDKLGHCYDFPTEVRQYLHEWLEEQQWHLLDPDNRAHEPRAQELLQKTIANLHRKYQELNGINYVLHRTRLMDAATTFQNKYSNCPCEFVRMMKQSLEKESWLLEKIQKAPKRRQAGETSSPETSGVKQPRHGCSPSVSPLHSSLHEDAKDGMEAQMVKSEPSVMKEGIPEMLHKIQAAKQRMESLKPRIQDYGELSKCWHAVKEHLQQMSEKIWTLESQLQSLQAVPAAVFEDGSGGGGGEGAGTGAGAGATFPPQGHQFQQQLLGEWQESQRVLRELMARQEVLDSHLQEQCLLRNELAALYGDTVPVLQRLQQTVVEEKTLHWRQQQQRQSNGHQQCEPAAVTLEQLQFWYESLAEVLILMHEQIQQVDPPHLAPKDPMAGHQEFLSPHLKTVQCLLISLVYSSFIVERQPDQVVLEGSRVDATTRLLVARKLNLPTPLPKVTVSALSEDQARQWTRDPSLAGQQTTSVVLKDDEAAMEFVRIGGGAGGAGGTTPTTSTSSSSSSSSPSPPHWPLSPTTPFLSSSQQLLPQESLCANFHLQLVSIGIKSRRGQERVTKQKFCFRFKTSFPIVQGINLELQVLSLPVVLISHTNQKCQALATVLWDNAFSVPKREPFEVPINVSWTQLQEELSIRCEKMTGRGLTASHLQFLSEKIFQLPGGDSYKTEVSFGQFCERALPDHNHGSGKKEKEKKDKVKKEKTNRRCTFWDWLYDAFRMIEKHLKEPWQKGYVEGFVSKAKAEKMLLCQEEGTFLLRFSDSKCGAISIAVVEKSNNGSLVVTHIEPMKLDKINFADKIKGRNKLVYLYPDIPKDHAFSEYYTPPTALGYSYKPYDHLNMEPASSLPEELAGLDISEIQSLVEEIHVPSSPVLDSEIRAMVGAKWEEEKERHDPMDNHVFAENNG
ncbi:signal transducer and activator of transcription 5B-like [Babylonia areolata]|uniref:signal transducer and activator of transcription 5B-like n=1 Tax=Babylonia areolata TaxID=304850 RepID=UPI003FD3522A